MPRITKLNQHGFHVLPLLLGFLFVGAVTFASLRILDSGKRFTSTNQEPNLTNQETTDSPVIWEARDAEWKTVGNVTPPACPEPFEIKTPVDLSKIESILYPGQTRGSHYKAHGGFKATVSRVEVKAPFDAQLVSGVRYIEQGEIQYLLAFVHPCGMMYRLDHLYALAPKIQEQIELTPEAKVDDTRGVNFQNPITFKAGEIIATEVGHRFNSNFGFDFGVYDLRKRNEAAKDPAYVAARGSEGSQSLYALCWLDLLSPASDSAKVKSLPATDFQMGKTSDYCK